MNPYRLKIEIRDLVRQIEDGTEVTPEVLAQIEALETEFEAKVETYAKLVAGENLTASSLRQEAAIMLHRARHHETCAERFKQAAFDLLNAYKTDEVKTPLFKVTINASPPSADLRPGVTVDQLPGEYVRVTRVPHLQKILEDHRAGVPLPADLVVVNTDNKHLRIRPK